VVYDDTVVPLDAITGCAVTIHKVTRGIVKDWWTRFELKGGDDDRTQLNMRFHHFSFGGEASFDDASLQIVQFAAVHISPKIALHIVTRVLAGRSYETPGLTVSREGLTRREGKKFRKQKVTYPWLDYLGADSLTTIKLRTQDGKPFFVDCSDPFTPGVTRYNDYGALPMILDTLARELCT
jgi:hypothetical protein